MPQPDEHSADDYEQKRMRLEIRYQRAHSTLTGAQARYAALREMPNANGVQVSAARQRVQLAQKRLDLIVDELDVLEDRESVA